MTRTSPVLPRSLTLATLLAVAAWGADDDDDDPPLGACAEGGSGTTSDGEAVAICDRFHDEAPLVRVADAEGVFHGSLSLETAEFVTRDGVARRLRAEDGTPFECAGTVPPTCAELPGFEGLHADDGPTHRWLYTLYRVEGELDGDDLRATRVIPAVLVTAEAIDALLATPLEGAITTRVDPRPAGDPPSDSIFDEETAPIRLVPTGERTEIELNTAGEVLAEARAFDVGLEIANRDEAVALADGTCAPSLASLGDRDPFVGSAATSLTLRRNPSMHGLGGHHLVFDNLPADALDLGPGTSAMSPGLTIENPLVNPWTWLADELDLAGGLAGAYGLHGNAFLYNLVLTIDGIADGGGGACTP